ncbi:MAG: hypothetical protein IAB80_11390 [Bacteroidetes bacterium]|uniref:Uncharacterized protein n=2 Tax=Candidatus Cryptobacteroides TaxID=2840523 RepID=A0A9D9NI41_9BACT|nr:hypothetical protein [Candidatus Cryptobacteroides faecigallinarum]MBO8479471.1 hypothetical protein [Candidatus Cryptobacteroides excrementipullorum]
MDEDRTYFFRPRVGENYSSGFNSLKTLVLGAYHFCWEAHAKSYGCTYYEQCVRAGLSKDYDELCPIYKDRMELYDGYYRISNSNIIEIDSYTEGERCPSYGEFTRFLTGICGRRISNEERVMFWNSVAFYNYIQHFLPEAEDFSYQERKSSLDSDFPAFAKVIEELRPDVIYIWTDAIKDAVESNLENLNGVSFQFCKRETAGSLTVWTAVVSYAGNRKHTDTDAFLNEFALTTKKDRMSAAEAILEAIGLCRNRKSAESIFHRLKYDDDFVTELTNIYQDLSGLNSIFNSLKDNISRLKGEGILYSNFYVPDARPVSGAGPEHLSLWGLSRDVSIDNLPGAMMPDDTLLLWIDEDSRIPMTVLAGVLGNIRHDSIRHLLLLMKASHANDSLYFSPIKNSCLAESIYEVDGSILINLTPDYRETIFLYPGGARPYQKFTHLIPSKYKKNKSPKTWFKTLLKTRMNIHDQTILDDISTLLYNAQDKNILYVETGTDGTGFIRCTDEKSADMAQLVMEIKKKSWSDKYGKSLLKYNDIQRMLNTNIDHIGKRVYDVRQKRKSPRRRLK